MKNKYKLSYVIIAFLFAFLPRALKAQNGLNFDGNNDVVQTTFPGIMGAASRTFEAWVNLSPSATANSCILDYGLNAVGSRNTFAISSSKQVSFTSGGTNANISTAANAVVPGQWTHVAFVLANGVGSFYVNGVFASSGNLSTVFTPSNGAQMTIGQRVSGGSIPFLGSIDEVRVWNYARSAAQISASMNQEFCFIPTGLVAYYKLNNGSAGGTNTSITTAPDASGNGYTGTLSGFSLTGNTSNWVSGVVLPVAIPTSTTTVIGCGSYSSPSGNYTWNTAGTYQDTVVSAAGCASAITINLTISNATSSVISQTACSSYTSPSGNHIWTTSGTYLDTIQNSTGCDSTMTIHLTINATASTLTETACGNYTSPSGNHTWNVSGTFHDTLTNAAGCDSILTIHLTILSNSPSYIFSQVACGSYTSPSGNFTWSTTGTYFDTIPNALGCDSVLIIQLNISPTGIATYLTESACFSYTSPSGKYVWTTSAAYKDTLTNAAGCDSIVQITLTITDIDASLSFSGGVLTSNEANADSYQWIDCGTNLPIAGMTTPSFTPVANGNYAVILSRDVCTDTSECFSIVNIGIHTITKQNHIQLYPNPTTDKFTVLAADFEGESRVLIQNVAGKVLAVYVFNTPEQLNAYAFDLSNLAAGVYFVRLENTAKQGITKIIKQ